jgi:WD40 repeat protein
MRSWKPHGGKVRVLAFSPDGKTLATAGGMSKNIWLWDTLTGAMNGTLPGHDLYPIDAAFSPDGRCFASLSNSGQVLVRNTQRIASSVELRWPLSARRKVTFAPDGRLLVAAYRGFSWWDDPLSPTLDPSTPTGTRERETREMTIEAVEFTPDNTHLLIGTTQLEIWTADSFTHIASIHRGLSSIARAMAVSPDSTLAAVAFRHLVFVYRLADRSMILHLGWGSKIIHALAFTPDGRSLLTAGADGLVRMWDVQTWKETRRFDWGVGKISAVAFAPDGLTAAAGGEKGEVVVWDLDV